MAQSFDEYQRDLEQHLTSLVGGAEANARSFAEMLVARVHWADDRPRMFSILVCHEGVTGIRYDFAAALEAALNTAMGALGSPGKAEAAMLALSCLLALRGVRRRVDNQLSAAILALHSRGGRSTVEEIHKSFNQTGLDNGQVDSVLGELKSMGAIQIHNGEVSLQEKVFVRYTGLPRITPPEDSDTRDN